MSEGSDEVGSGGGVGQGDFGNGGDGAVVVDLVTVQDAAVAVGGVGAEADVGDDGEVGSGVLDSADGLLHGAVGSAGIGAGVVFVARAAEENDARDAQCGGFGGEGGGAIGREQ